MTADIATSTTLTGLRETVNEKLRTGWRVEGAPFHDPARAMWCWAVVFDQKPVAPGGIKLREPVRTAR